MNTVSYTLNGTVFTFDADTGALETMELPGTGAFVEGGRGLIDMSWPVHNDYDTLRLNPTGEYDKCPPEITFDGKTVTLSYRRMPRTVPTPDTMTELEGGVSATVTLTALEDGKSIALRCRVENHSQTPVVQILFPDINGIPSRTENGGDKLTMLAGSCCPFRELKSTPDSRENFFAWTESAAGRFYNAGGLQTAPYAGRWYDIGSRDGGFSVFRRHWGWGPDDMSCMGYSENLWVKLDNLRNRLRIAALRYTDLKKDECYDSGDYVLTPHAGSWINGIQPYKEYLNSNVKRVLPMPERAREMLGFRTVFMSNGYPTDPTDYCWKYSDMPTLAEDMKEHGIYDLNVWGCFNYSLPMGPQRFYSQWGGVEEFRRNVDILKDMGVTVTPLVSWISLWDETCQAYGITERSGSWAETPKSIPMFKAPYCKRWSCLQLEDHSLENWREDVRQGLRYLRDTAGCPNICWDQYVLGKNQDDIVHDMINEYRLETEKMYPGTVFSSESTLYFESELDNTDFTWNWLYWKNDRDLRPYMHVISTCRPNINVDSDPVKAKLIFMDNLMMNVYPTLPENYNGSALISDYPEFSAAIKTCAFLRREYLEYFTRGTMISDCAVTEEPKCRTTGYVLEGKMLLIVYKWCAEEFTLPLDLTPYLEGGDFDARISDEENSTVAQRTLKAKDSLTVSGKGGSLYMIEITGR